MTVTKRQMIKELTAIGALAALPRAGLAQGRGAGPAVLIDVRSTAGPVRRAAQDLAADIGKVLGVAPRFTATRPEGDAIAILVETSGIGDRESFRLRRRGRAITLSGADMRGTIYAIYQFAQDHLGVDPMYFWTDNFPDRRTSIDMPDGADRRFPKPVFDYRGFFINDEDQLTGWAPAEPGQQTNIAPEVMDKVYETILRLKGNMVVPSTWSFPDDLQNKAASARGLILSQHHATPVGVNAVRWPDKAPYNFTDHPDILRRAWKNSVDLYDRDQEILWTVGLRGLSDMPYSALDPNVAGDPAKMGAVIGRAIGEQMRIVRARFPKAEFVTNLWSEGADLMREGHLTIPPDVITAWPDKGWGFITDNGQVRRGQGLYYHVAMLNGRANQLSEMVPVDRIHAEFGRFIRAGATRFALVNVSDIRAVAMTAKTTMDVAWSGAPDGGAGAVYRKWAGAQFGAAASEPMGEFYADYFRTIPRARLPDDQHDLEIGDQYYHQVARELMIRIMVAPPYYRTFGQSPQWIPPRVSDFGEISSDGWIDRTAARELRMCADAAPRWDRLLARARALEPLVRRDRRDYFRYAVLTMISVNANGGGMLLAISRAAQAVRSGDMAEAKRQAAVAGAQLAEIDRCKAYGAYGKWRHWWRGDWLTNTSATGELLTIFKQWIDDPVATTPLPMIDVDQKAYYHILRYQGTRSVSVS